MMLRLQLLGRVRLSYEAENKNIHLKRQSATLLAYLAMHRDRDHARDTIIEQFWPECDPTRGRSNLSSALWRLRRAIGPRSSTLIKPSIHGTTGISEDIPIWLDVKAFECRIMATLGTSLVKSVDCSLATLEQGLALYHGELMPGWYDDWILAERERLQGLYLGGLLQLMAHRAEQGLLDAAIATGRQILKVEPLHETTHRKLIELYMASGQPAAATRQYQDCFGLLLEELGVAPCFETQSTYAKLRQTSAHPA
jgi:DNA-binding SARP family transcriptional activator